MKKMHRRGFFGRISALSAAVGATLAGVIPELGAAASPAPMGPGDGTVPPIKALPSADAVSMYSAALGDLDILKLASLARQPNRIDPPTSSGDTITSDGTRIRGVSMPVSSTVDGSVVAYLVFGRMDRKLEQGMETVHYRVMVTPDGKVRAAHAGQVVPSPKPQWNDALLMAYFPDINRSRRTGVPPTPGNGPVSDAGGPGMQKAAWSPFMRKAQNAAPPQFVNPQLDMCLHGCEVTFNACRSSAWNSLLQGGVILAGCIGCIVINSLTVANKPPPTTLEIAKACWAVCTIASALLANALAALEACNTNNLLCVDSCHTRFGVRPPLA